MPKITTRDLVEKLNLEIVSGEKGLDREIIIASSFTTGRIFFSLFTTENSNFRN